MNPLALFAAQLAGKQPKVVRRSWRERLFSRPWRPWQVMKMIWEPAGESPGIPLELRRAASPERITSPVCLHCALLGSIELWHKTYAGDVPPLHVKAHVLESILQTMDSLDATWAGKPMQEH